MKITPVPHGLDLLASDLVRSPGLHMSQIYGSLFEKLEPSRYKPGGAIAPLMAAVGTAWEKHLEYLMGKAGIQVFRPGELVTSEGIAYSPDGLLDNQTRLAEYKVKWWLSSKDMPCTSASRFPPKLDKDICQIQSYCFNLEIGKARIYLLFVQGPGRNPVLLVYDLEFTPTDLQTNWQMMMNHARHEKLL